MARSTAKRKVVDMGRAATQTVKGLVGADGTTPLVVPPPVKIETTPVQIGARRGPGRNFEASRTRAGDEITLTEPGKQSVHPVGVRILIRDWVFARTTAGGILLSDETVEAHEHLNYIGQVMELGPDCYKKGGPSRYPSERPWCKAGDWVMFGKYAGQRVRCKSTGETYRYINDGDVLGVTEAPHDWKVYLDS